MVNAPLTRRYSDVVLVQHLNLLISNAPPYLDMAHVNNAFATGCTTDCIVKAMTAAAGSARKAPRMTGASYEHVVAESATEGLHIRYGLYFPAITESDNPVTTAS